MDDSCYVHALTDQIAAAAYRAITMINRKFFLKRGFAAALSLLPFATSVPAAFEDGLPPTIEEAHAFLGGTFQRYPVALAGANLAGGNVRRAAPGRVAAYGGEGCVSELSPDRRNRAMKVDWSAIAAVEEPGPNAVDLVGSHPHGNLRVYFPNHRAARSAANAFEVLRSACVPPSLTARR